MKWYVQHRRMVVEALVHMVLLAAIGIFVYTVFFQPRAEPFGPVSGTELLGVDDIVGQGQSETLLLALSPTCPYCLVSRRFYMEIIDRRNQINAPLQVIAVVDTTVSIEPQRQVLAEEGVVLDSIIVIPSRENNIFGVPMVMTLSDRGLIGDVWIGALDSLEEASVFAAIGLDR